MFPRCCETHGRGAHSTAHCGAGRPSSCAAGRHPARAQFRAHHGADRRCTRSASYARDRVARRRRTVKSVASALAVAKTAPATVIEYVASSPAVTCVAPAPVIDNVGILTCRLLSDTAPAIEHVATPAVSCAATAPVIEYVAAPAVIHAVPAPVIDHVASSPAVPMPTLGVRRVNSSGIASSDSQPFV